MGKMLVIAACLLALFVTGCANSGAGSGDDNRNGLYGGIMGGGVRP